MAHFPIQPEEAIVAYDLQRVFSQRLNELIGERHFGDKKMSRLAAACDTDRARVHAWVNGEGLPRLEAFLAICDYFDVPADNLLGRVPPPAGGRLF